MQLIRSTASQPPALPARKGSWRLRPGEVPSWIDVPLDREATEAWRFQAEAVGLGVDSWLALLVEYELVRLHFTELGLHVGEVIEEAKRSQEVPRLAPTGGLRQWAGQLSGQKNGEGAHPPDELPSVVLPERLLAQLAPAAVPEFLTAAVEGQAAGEALLVEGAATTFGLTMETWAYLTALRLQAAKAA